MSYLVEQIKADREAGTPGKWESEAGSGPVSVWSKSSLGVWSHHKFDAAVALNDDEREPDDEKWLCGIWGELGSEDFANARRIARVPDLEDAYLAAHARIEAQAALIAELTRELRHAIETYEGEYAYPAPDGWTVALARAEEAQK